MKKFRFLNLCVVLLVSILIMVICTFTVFRPIFSNQAEKDMLLSLTATGEKNEVSWGAEVRIESICVNGTDYLDLTQFTETSGWTMDGSLLCVYGETHPTTLEIPMESVHSLEVTMIGQCGSGIVEITCADSTEKIDL